MKLIAILLAVPMLAFAENESVYCCQHPSRVAGNYRYDLRPLFNWWSSTNQSSTNRPYSSWVRIRGTYKGIRNYGWLLDATIFDAPKHAHKATVIIWHPPSQEKRNFEAWKKQLTDAGAAWSSANSRFHYNSSTAESQHDTAQTFYSVANAVSSPRLNQDFNNAGASHSSEAQAARQQRDAAGKDQGNAEVAISALKAKLSGLPPGKEYTLDWFAYPAGKTADGIPIYDVGRLIGEPGVQ